VGTLYENWDGTGQPDHLLQGQIPLRSRILRVLVDFIAIEEGPGAPGPEAVFEMLDEHAGTLYDPMVLVHLRAILQASDPDAERIGSAALAIPELEPGMVLAEDLCTDAGLKLLARRTVLTPATLDLIRRRHQLEPIERGARVRRRPGA
jgi:hypothetical protein